MSSVSAITTAGTLGFSVSPPIGYNVLTTGLAPIITTDGYALYRFHSSGTMNLSGIVAKYSPATLQVMCVGGGSGGRYTNNSTDSGGSAGGFIETTLTLTNDQTIEITVGNGGQRSLSGQNTSISFSNSPEYNMIAYGGTPTMSGAPTAYPGGICPQPGVMGGGGGGGSAGNGINGSSQKGGDGGPGTKPTKPGIATQYPTTYWAAGGGGRSDWSSGTGGIGGIGGGGAGSRGSIGSNGYSPIPGSPNGQTNSGSGGGDAGTGGSGIVMIAVKIPTYETPPPPSYNGSAVVFGAGDFNYGKTTDFGATWTFGTIPGITLNNGFQISCGIVNSAPLWVLVGSNGTSLVSISSTNGTTWSAISTSISSIIRNTNSSTYCSCLSFGNGIFMASGFTGVFTEGAPVAISTDGINWVNGGTPFGASKLTNAVAFGDGRWVAVCNQGNTTNNVMTSTNVSIANSGSIVWTAANSIPVDPLYSVIYASNRWFIGGLGGKTYYSATNLPTSTFTVKDYVPTNSALPYTLSHLNVAGNTGVLAIGSWLTSGGATNRVYKIDSIDTTTFIAVGGGSNIYTLNTADVVNNSITLRGAYFSSSKAVISTDSGSSWVNINDINTNMASGCFGVAFAK
jgi:hypothetical protein